MCVSVDRTASEPFMALDRTATSYPNHIEVGCGVCAETIHGHDRKSTSRYCPNFVSLYWTGYGYGYSHGYGYGYGHGHVMVMVKVMVTVRVRRRFLRNV